MNPEYITWRETHRAVTDQFADEPVEQAPPGLKQKFRWLTSHGGYTAILLAAVVGPGSMATMLKGGAAYPWVLFWPIVLSGVFCFVGAYAGSLTTQATGLTPVELLRTYFGRVVPWIFVLINLWIWVFVGMFQGTASASASWLISGQTGHAVYYAVPSTVIVLFMYLAKGGGFKIIKRVTWACFGILLVAYVINFAVSLMYGSVDLGDVASGLVPQWPSGSGVIIAAAMGGAVGIFSLMQQGYAVLDEGVARPRFIKHAQYDTILHGILVFTVYSLLIYWAASAVYPPRDLQPTGAVDAALSIGEIAGGWAPIVFGVGLLAVAWTSLAGVIFYVVYPLADSVGIPPTFDNRRFAILWASIVVVCGIGGPLLQEELIDFGVIALATANFVSIPIMLIWFWMLNSKRVIPRDDLRPGRIFNTLYIFMVAVVGVASWQSVGAIKAFLS